MPELSVGEESYVGSVELPTLGLELPVASGPRDGHVDLACRISGSVYEGDLVLAGNDHRAAFGGLGLLRPGDAAYVSDTLGHRFAFVVEAVGASASDRAGAALTLLTQTDAGEPLVVTCVAAAEHSGDFAY
ncbi:sortase [Olsenella sp. An290]|uniref:sortase n=1 Tax=Olsenella sp. An290 TaxID=1965625 RepID=UPI000B39E4E7|nr:sortase [Olsenella sp. An290]OUO34491.1 hypothetical protein B5F84_06535 [Olsenella sp. An290]